MSDVLAIGALQAAAELGVAVPGELSIVGFDDSPAAALASPPLTTVAQPHEKKGLLAATWLLEAIEHGRGSLGLRREILPTELIVRQTTAPSTLSRSHPTSTSIVGAPARASPTPLRSRAIAHRGVR